MITFKIIYSMTFPDTKVKKKSGEQKVVFLECVEGEQSTVCSLQLTVQYVPSNAV